MADDEKKERLIPDGKGGFNRIIDGDTEVDATGNRYRREGSNTREIATVKKDKYGEEYVAPPQLGAAAQSEAVEEVIRKGKFYNIEEKGVDKYGRTIIRRTNNEGEDLDETLIAAGIAEPNAFTAASDLANLEAARARRQLTGEATDYELLGDKVKEEFDKGGLRFKSTALNEANYSPDYHSSVAFRDHDRNLDNEQIGFFSQAGSSLGQSWQGIKEGWYGYMDATGQVTGIEMLENLGEQGVARARANMREAPEVLLDYREVNNVFDGFQYVMNNTAMAAPYFATSIAGLALAAPTMLVATPFIGAAGAGMVALGATALPNSLIFSGQIWNEMEGEKGAAQWAAATAGGVSMSVVERFGLSKLIPKTSLLSKEGIQKGAQALVEQRAKQVAAGITKKGVRLKPLTQLEAEKILTNAVRSEQTRLLKAAGALDPEMLARISLAQVGKASARGAAVESITEILQESIQMATAAGFSDKVYSADDIKHRLINAGIAGGAIGGTFSGVASGRSQLKNYMARKDKTDKADINKLEPVEAERVKREAAGEIIPSVKDNIKVADDRAKVTARQTASNLSLVSPQEEDAAYINNTVNKFKNSIDQDLTRQLVNDAIDSAIQDPTLERAKLQAEVIKEKYGAVEAQLFLDAAQSKVARQDKAVKQETVNTAEDTVQTMHDRYKSAFVGVKKWFTANTELKEYAGTAAVGVLNLLRGAEKAAIEAVDLVKSKIGLDIMSRVGMTTFGRFFSGDNHRAAKDKIEGRLRRMVNQSQMIKNVLFNPKARTNVRNTIKVSKILKAFGKAGGMEAVAAYLEAKRNEVVVPGQDSKVIWADFKGDLDYTEAQALTYYQAAKELDDAYRAIHNEINTAYTEETGAKALDYIPGYWYKFDGFDWKKVKSDKKGFMRWAKKNGLGTDEIQLEQLFESITLRGEATFGEEYSLVSGTQPWVPWTFNERTRRISIEDPDGFAQWASDNLFEQLHRSQREAAKYSSSTQYFGHNGRKLTQLFNELRAEQAELPDGLTETQIDKLAYYVISMINSEHGNFNRVKNPMLAKLNSILTNWSIFAGLTLSAAASLPETVMIYFKVNDDALFKQATDTLFKQLGGAYSKFLAEEVKRSKVYLERTGLTAQQSSAIDRLASGEKDIAFLRAHEAFFSVIGLTTFTQFQRRINATFAIDFVRSHMQTLLNAPRKDYGIQREELNPFSTELPGDTEAIERAALESGKVELGFDFDEFNSEEQRAYTYLSNLGIDVEGLYEAYALSEEIYRDSLFAIEGEAEDPYYEQVGDMPLRQRALNAAVANSDIANTSKRELFQDAQNLDDFIKDQMDTAIYNFVNERIQNPQSSNRPLFFQDPHYQLFTQFNGFISTFTSVVIPQLYRNQLAKGTLQVKYDTFVLIVMMMVLGGASQYIKDEIKFGKPSPYLDGPGYIQRALYSSGVLGQYERAIDLVAPLYPDRSNWLLSTLGGDTGPSSRNIQKVVKGAGQLLEGNTEGAAKSVLSTVPVTSSINRVRDAATDILHMRSPAASLNYKDSYLKELMDLLS